MKERIGYFYIDDVVKNDFYSIRKPKPEYYNPMAQHMIDYDNIRQVQILFLGELIWINMEKHKLFFDNLDQQSGE